MGLILPFKAGTLCPSTPELEWLHQYCAALKPKHICEFGCGITSWVANDAAKPESYVAIEEFEPLLTAIKQHCPTISLAKVDPLEAVDLDDVLKDKIDLLIIDSSAGTGSGGLGRHLALQMAEPYLADGARVIMHDWHRGRSGKAVRQMLETRGYTLESDCKAGTGFGAYMKPPSLPVLQLGGAGDGVGAAPAVPILPGLSFDYSKFSIVTAIDEAHIEKLLLTLPTWVKRKKATNPILVFINGIKCSDRRLDPIRLPNVQFIPWDNPPAEGQRERMLSSFIFGVSRHVKTPWHLKLDCVTFAYDETPLWSDEFEKYYAVATPWGYTIPSTAICRLDYWLDGLHKMGAIKTFKGSKPWKAYQKQISGRRYMEPRFCSWYKFMRTCVAQEIVANLPLGRLAVPSEDTTCWAWLDRQLKPWLPLKGKRLGLAHSKDLEVLKKWAV